MRIVMKSMDSLTMQTSMDSWSNLMKLQEWTDSGKALSGELIAGLLSDKDGVRWECKAWVPVSDYYAVTLVDKDAGPYSSTVVGFVRVEDDD